MAHLVSICSNTEDSFFALRSDGNVYRCQLSPKGSSWELVDGAPNVDVLSAKQIADEIETYAAGEETKGKTLLSSLAKKWCRHLRTI
jgi:hypothetical protein